MTSSVTLYTAGRIRYYQVLDHFMRLLYFPQGKTELREYLRKNASRSYVERLSDLHLLLWLSKQPNLDSNDLILLCDAVKDKKPIMEGYRVIIDSIAGI